MQVNPSGCSKVAVGAVAERWASGSLALAKVESGFLGDLQFLRLQAGSLVGTVAERAVARPSTGAPPVGSGFQLKLDRLSVGAFRFLRHMVSAVFRLRRNGSGDRFMGSWVSFERKGRNRFAVFRVSFCGDFVEIRCSKPGEEDCGRCADKIADAHGK